MKEKEILKQAINAIYGKNPTQLMFCIDKTGKVDTIGLMFEGTRIYLFNTDKFPFSYNKEKCFDLDKVLKISSDYNEAIPFLQKYINHVKGRKPILATKLQRQTQPEEYVYVDTSYLKYFENPTYEIAGKCDLVRVYEREILVGIICPINYKES